MTARNRTGLRAAAMISALVVVAAACGGSSSKKGSGGSASTVAGSSGTPKPGGHLTMATEAEIDGFDPTANRWDTTGLMYAFTVYDPLASFGKDNKVHPYLAKSIDHSADYVDWTITLRPNITFSNGDPLTSDAVVQDLTAIKKAPLTGHAFDPIDTVSAVDTMTAKVHMNEPWVDFPVYLSGQPGAVIDPKMFKDPNRGMHPIGTGPFIMQQWVPGDHFSATKNPNYWQKGLPYLDSVTYRPIIEGQSRENSLLSGNIDMFHSSDAQTIVDLKGKSGVKFITDLTGTQEHSSDFVMLNTGKPPLDDPVLRQALAYATDVKTFNNVINFGINPPSNGPFPNPASPYHTATGYPSFDLKKAQALVKQYESAHHVSSISFELGTTNSGRSVQTASLLQDQWKKAGINVTIKQVEQSQYILNALQGNYNAYEWRQFGDPDPDAEYLWWSTTTALAEGQLALNFARNRDAQVQADLQKGRTDPTPSDRVAAYQDISKRFAVDIPYLWVDETIWQIAFKPNVHGILGGTLPDGIPGSDHTIGGVFLMSHVWMG